MCSNPPKVTQPIRFESRQAGFRAPALDPLSLGLTYTHGILTVSVLGRPFLKVLILMIRKGGFREPEGGFLPLAPGRILPLVGRLFS